MTGYHDRPWAQLRPGAEYRPHLFEARREFLLGLARPGERALDLGAGAGDFAAALAEAGVDAVGADVSALAVRDRPGAAPGTGRAPGARRGPAALPRRERSTWCGWAA